ncbi:MAG: NAD(P)H-hydrate dehydratase, partial [Desulfohalobiaceae bacterium]
GSRDIIANSTGILAEIHSPSLPALEAMGGTGDTVTGLVGSLLDSGMDVVQASRIASLVNRTAGQLTHPTPATQVSEIVANIPHGLQDVLHNQSELLPDER